MYRIKTLKNGIRLITSKKKTTDTVTVLALFGVGSREELPKNEGIAHFLEHMMFKGTKKRPETSDIYKELDYIGASYNAFTGKEYTGFWIKSSKENIHTDLDIISDILINPSFHEKEIESEKGPVIEEINMYEDSPMRDIPSLLENMLYEKNSLAHDQLGNKKNVRGFKRKDLLDFYNKYYTSKNLVIAIVGNFEEDKIIKDTEKYFSKTTRSISPKRKPLNKKGVQKKPNISIKYKKTDQTNLSLGFKTISIGNKKEDALEILDVIMGGNSSSRLYENVREKNGLSYYIYSYTSLFTDSGYFAIQCGVGNNKVEKTLEIISKEIRRIKEKGISEEELDGAKNYIKGASSISLESSSSIAEFLASQEILKKKVLTPKDKFDRIDAVKKEDVNKIAKEIFVLDQANLAIIGPQKDTKSIIELLQF